MMTFYPNAAPLSIHVHTIQADRKSVHKYNIAAITPYTIYNIVTDTYHSTVEFSLFCWCSMIRTYN